MAGTFPTLATGRLAFYGTEQTLTRRTAVIQFVNDTEQRWRAAQPLFSGVMQYSNGNFYDLSTLMDFFVAQKGSFDATWSISVEDPPGTTTTYNYMTFDQDSFAYTETGEGRFSATLKVRQVRKG